MSADPFCIDLFSGAGGFSEGAQVYLQNLVGIEWDDDAATTHELAGHKTIHEDVRAVDPGDFDGPGYLHLHGSPPCTTFSTAGKRAGSDKLDRLAEIVRNHFDGVLPEGSIADDIDETTLLATEPARWIYRMMPDSITFEQVKGVLPLWEVYAEILREIGYSVWTGVLSAEQYGLPQTRQRAWLGASRKIEVSPPKPTHSKYYVNDPTRLDEGVLPWLPMSVVLGEGAAGFPRKADNDDVVIIDGERYRARDISDTTTRPAQTVTEKARSMEVFTHYAPAGVGQKSNPAKPRPISGAPAPTVTGMGNHYLFHADDFSSGEQMTTTPELKRARRITAAEGAALQGFPEGYPFMGSRTSSFRQIGNAVPPPIATVALASVLPPEITDR